MRKVQRASRASCAVALLTLLCGCESIENPRTLAPGQPDVAETRSRELDRSQFDDIPIPPGFEFVTRGNRSFSFTRGGVRVGRFVYWGRLEVEEVTAFFRRNMELRAYGWSLRNQDVSDQAATLDYIKKKVDCRVTVTRENGGTYINVDVAGPAS